MKLTKKRIFNALIFALGWFISLNALALSPVYADVNQPIAVRPSSPLVAVRLPANPSTGYQWVLVDYDHTLMKMPTSYYVSGPRDLIGAPGYAVWQFKFKKSAFTAPRRTIVNLEYKRVWEKTAVKKQVITLLLQPSKE